MFNSIIELKSVLIKSRISHLDFATYLRLEDIGEFRDIFVSMSYDLSMSKITPIESEFATSEEAAAYDAWFRAKVERAMASDTPSIPHAEVMAMAKAILDKHKPR